MLLYLYGQFADNALVKLLWCLPSIFRQCFRQTYSLFTTTLSCRLLINVGEYLLELCSQCFSWQNMFFIWGLSANRICCLHLFRMKMIIGMSLLLTFLAKMSDKNPLFSHTMISCSQIFNFKAILQLRKHTSIAQIF